MLTSCFHLVLLFFLEYVASISLLNSFGLVCRDCTHFYYTSIHLHFLIISVLLQAIAAGQACIAEQCNAIEAWAADIGKPKREQELLRPPQDLDAAIVALIGDELEAVYRNVTGKKERGEAVSLLKERVRCALIEGYASSSSSSQGGSSASGNSAVLGGNGISTSSSQDPYAGKESTTEGEQRTSAPSSEPCSPSTNGAAAASSSLASGQTYSATDVALALKRVESGVMRGLVLKEGYRADGRGVDEVRPIWSRAGVLPRTHGSALFTRGETQAMAVTTLGE
jgi:polyribonucleotide nucleotidyltransferase